MNPKIQKLCVVSLVLGVFVAQSAVWAEGSDTLPLMGKTQAPAKNRDTLTEVGSDQPAPMVPGYKPKKKPDTKADVVSGLKDGKKEEPSAKEEAPDPSLQAAVFIAAIDVYGTDRFTEVDLKEMFGKDLDRWVELGLKGEPEAYEMQKILADKAKKKWELGFAEWTLAQFFTPNGLAVHLTLDVVEKKDMAARMTFLPDPKENFPDPDGLIAQWRKYEDLALGMVEAGEILPDTDSCVALHCPFAHKNPKLKPFEKIFVEGVKKNYKALFAILKGDARPEMRAAAAFLLPYYTNGKEVVAAMVERIPDSDVIVRNNVLRVLGDIAEFHRDLPVPLAPVLKAFDYPRVSDRAKALNVVFQLAGQSPAARETIRKTSTSQLLRMLASKQPDHRELAHGILRKISGRDFTVDDMKSWQRWAKSVAKDNAITRK